MAFCRGRLFSDGQEGPRFEDVPTFLIGDFETEVDSVDDDSSFQDSSMETGSPIRMISNGLDDGFWPDFTSPTPVSSPQPRRPVSRIRHSKLSPIAMKLEESLLNNSNNDSGFDNPHSPNGSTPPHNRLKALRLFDTPHTPKSLLQKAQRTNRTSSLSSQKSRLLFNNNNNTLKAKKYIDEKPEANVNPFTPKNNTVNSGIKRLRPVESVLDQFSSLNSDMEDEMPSSKKIALREINTSRYNEEFYQVCKLGDGEFGSVYKCINRLDGVTYAIKKSRTPVAGSVYERNAMNEVYAHAVLGKHPQVVRYYSAWSERGHMFIQNEYCNGGSLADFISDNEKTGRQFSEDELRQILRQLALGLKYIHSQNLVHLDLKPENVFIHRNPKILNSPESGMEEDIEDDEDCMNGEMASPIIYKIGDLGHVTSLANPSIEDGDCRYLANEVLQEDTNHLAKADIFSLALTIFVAGGGGELPKNGDEWHAIRGGQLPHMFNYSNELNDLLRSMIHPDPAVRPCASTLANHPILCPYGAKSRAQLKRELNEQKLKNELLTRQLKEAQQSKPTRDSQVTESTVAGSSSRSSRLIGRRVNRSMSLTVF